MKKNMTKQEISLAISIFIFLIPLIFSIFYIFVYKDSQFYNNCVIHLQRAVDVNTVEESKKELELAISYAQKNGFTDELVSMSFQYSENDWYKNITQAYEEINNIPENASSSEKTNVLIKIRENLTHVNNKGIKTVTIPEEIFYYQNNPLFLWIMITCLLIGIILVFIGLHYEII